MAASSGTTPPGTPRSSSSTTSLHCKPKDQRRGLIALAALSVGLALAPALGAVATYYWAYKPLQGNQTGEKINGEVTRQDPCQTLEGNTHSERGCYLKTLKQTLEAIRIFGGVAAAMVVLGGMLVVRALHINHRLASEHRWKLAYLFSSTVCTTAISCKNQATALLRRIAHRASQRIKNQAQSTSVEVLELPTSVLAHQQNDTTTTIIPNSNPTLGPSTV